MRKLTCLVILLAVPLFTKPARADEPGAPPPGAPSPPPAPPAKAAEPVKTAVSPPHPVILYIQDWGHLAEVTHSDDKLFDRADSLVNRAEASRQITTVGWLLGGSVATAATLSRLSTDHWTNFTKYGVAGGVSFLAVSMAISWFVAPDHSDLVSVINEWNQRHPERPLAP
jgi:hypothetical protein